MARLRSLRRPVVTTLSVLTMGAARCGVSVGAPTQSRDSVLACAVSRSASMNRWANSVLRRMPLEQKVGQLFVSLVHGTLANAADQKNSTDFGVDTPAQVVRKYHFGGVIYFHNSDADNIVSPTQVAELSNGLQRAAMSSGSRLPLTIGTDQESGKVTRIGTPATEFPGAMPLGAGRSAENAKQAAAIMGSELRAMGVNQNLAPDSDVNSNLANPVIGVRSFSGEPDLESRMVAAQVAGYQNSGKPYATVSATAKHFPGHGDTATDSHADLPVIHHTKEQWQRIDAPPFRAAIMAGIDTIMSGHLAFPSIDPSGEPGTLSPKILTGLLRDELGYQGVVITDSLRMQGVRTLHPDVEIPVLALQAGADQLLMPANMDVAVHSVLDAVRRGQLTEQRIDQSVQRVLELKWKRGVLTHPTVNVCQVGAKVGTKAHLAAARRITDTTTTVLRNDATLLPLERKPNKVLVVGGDTDVANTLAAQVDRRGPSVSIVPIDADTTDATIAEAVNAAKSADLVVVLTYNAAREAKQRELLDRLNGTGTPVVAVATDVPYDAGYVDGQRTWLTTYSTRAVATESLTRVLFVEVSPHGTLPVDIPSGADRLRVRYPFGTGLTW